MDAVKSNLPLPNVSGSVKLPVSPANITKMAKMNPTSLSSMSSIKGGTPTPAQVALNYLLFTLYSLVGTLIYYPAFIVNIPESTLEETLPKQDLCMRMGFSKRICKKKIKCLLKKCDYLDDPTGYKLDKEYKKPCNRKLKQDNITEKITMVGGKKDKTRKYRGKKYAWKRYLSKELKQKLVQEYQKNILNIMLGKKKKKGKKRVQTKKYYGGKAKNILNHNTCRNKKTGILCSLRDGNVSYTIPTILARILQKKTNIINMFGGGNESEDPVVEKIKSEILDLSKKHNEKLYKTFQENSDNVLSVVNDFKSKYPSIMRIATMFPSKVSSFIEKNSNKITPFIKNINIDNIKALSQKMANASDISKPSDSTDTDELLEKKALIRSFFVEKIKTKTLFKLSIVIKVMQKIFELKGIKNSPKESLNLLKESKGTSMAFPWVFDDPNMCLSDKIKCLSAHITQTEIDMNKNKELYEKCFVCKHCTLRNTASTIWGNVIKGILSGDKSKQFDDLINTLYGKLRPYIKFSFMTDKQYYLTTLVSLQLAIQNLDVEQISTSFKTRGNSIFMLKELILGIPLISIEDQSVFNDDIEYIKTYFQAFKELGVVEEINGIYYESLMRRYFEIEQDDYDEKLDFLKNITSENYELLYTNYQNRRYKTEGVYEKFYYNDIEPDEMKYFSHFDNDQSLMEYVDRWDYEELSKRLQEELEEQYSFLLDQNNFDSEDSIKTSQNDLDEQHKHLLERSSSPYLQESSGPLTSEDKEKYEQLRLLRDLALKLF